MRLGIVSKLLIPLSALFAALTYVTTTLQLDLYAEEQIETTKLNALGTASEAAMLFDTSFSTDVLKRLVTVIALDEHVVQTLIISPKDDQILASSRYRHANHQLDAQPLLIQQAYQQSKQTGLHYFTDTAQSHYALAYPIVAISENNTDSLDYVLLIYFDKLLLDNQYAEFKHKIIAISAGFLVLLVTLLYLLVNHFVRKPLDTFSHIIKQQSASGNAVMVDLNSKDEFGDIADEFNRMRTIEMNSLVVANRATQAAQDLAAKKTQFLANMSHELRTPINGILGMAQLCKQAESEQKKQFYIDHLTHSSQLLLSVVNDILDFSKLDDHSIQLYREDTVLSVLVMRVANLIYVTAKDKHLNFTVDIDENAPYSIFIDQQRTQQILLNILNNAVKFTENGDISLKISFKWQSNNDGIMVLSVSDTGIGIAQEHMASLFDPFEQADTSISRKYGGTGLGLAICKALLTTMEGDIKVVSTQGQGSLFRVAIPCSASTFRSHLLSRVEAGSVPTLRCPENAPLRAKSICKIVNEIARQDSQINLDDLDENWRSPPFIFDEYNAMEQLTHVTSIDKSDGKEVPIGKKIKANVLLVEDNDINALVAKTMLESIGHIVTVAKDGKIAVKEHKKQKFDIILMDVQMPVMDGYLATQSIRSLDAETTIVGLSANVMQDEIEKAYAVGMNDYLHKPVILEELDACLNKHLNS